MWKKCYDLKLGETIENALTRNSLIKRETITRVPGGWLYVFGEMEGTTSVFIPFDNEFQEEIAFAKQYSDKKDDEFKFGDIVRAKCTAIGRYIGDNKCVYISAMTSDRIVTEVHRTGDHANDYDLPVVSDEELQKYRK